MSVKTAYRAFFLPEWGGSVLKKRAAAWFTMRSWGLGISPNKRPDGNYWPKGPCLLQYTRPVNRVSKALCAGSCLSYNGEDSRTDDALHEMKRSNVQTVSRLLIAAFD